MRYKITAAMRIDPMIMAIGVFMGPLETINDICDWHALQTVKAMSGLGQVRTSIPAPLAFVIAENGLARTFPINRRRLSSPCRHDHMPSADACGFPSSILGSRR